jgi:ATP-dependent DNA helicase RecQ
LDTRLVAEAVEHIRRGYLPIEPRKQWPGGGRIPLNRRNEEGRALSRWGDGGWGDRVAENRAAGRFDDDLLDAAVDLIRDRWQPDPSPTWVTVVPSTRFPGVTAEFAARLAERLGLGFVEAIERVADREPQGTMNNSAMQCQNVEGVFVATGSIDPGPVLLVDDVVDSRWTMTLVGAALRHGGSGPVYPFALADAAGRST